MLSSHSSALALGLDRLESRAHVVNVVGCDLDPSLSPCKGFDRGGRGGGEVCGGSRGGGAGRWVVKVGVPRDGDGTSG